MAPNGIRDEGSSQRDTRLERLADLERELRKRPEETAVKIREIAARHDEDATMRAAIVRLVPLLPADEAEQTALSVLADDPSEVVRANACTALVQCGSERALGPLADLAVQGPERLRAQAQFAHIVISHRLKRPSPFFKLPRREEGVTPADRSSGGFRSSPLTEALRIKVIKQLDAGHFKLGDYSAEGLEFQCGKTEWAVLLQDPLVPAGLTETLRRSPSVLGVVARLSDEHKQWSVARIVLAGPMGRDRCYVAVYRTDGVLDLYGTGSLAEGAIEMVAARRPGAAAIFTQVKFAGALSLNGVAAQRKLRGQVPLAFDRY
jgi:hypothetical protein